MEIYSTECTNLMNITKNARDVNVTWVSGSPTEKKKETSTLADDLLSSLAKTTMVTDTDMNASKNEITILTGILLPGEMLPS
jgi:uncharacterized Fe-S radical SAM superfamily protein PflX